MLRSISHGLLLIHHEARALQILRGLLDNSRGPKSFIFFTFMFNSFDLTVQMEPYVMGLSIFNLELLIPSRIYFYPIMVLFL